MAVPEINMSAIVNADNERFYRYLKRHQLRVQKCTGCGALRYPARSICPKCLGADSEWVKLSGDGVVEALAWYFQNLPGGQAADGWSQSDCLPYNVAVVELAEGPHVFANIDGVAFGEIRIGQQVQANFVDVTDNYATLHFRPMVRT